MAISSLGFNKSSSKNTGRTQSGTRFPSEFVSDLNKTLGGPMTMNDLFKLMPRTRSLFGFGPTQAEGPEGQFNLGFGAPKPEAPPMEEEAPAAPTGNLSSTGVVGQVERRRNRRPDTPEELAADAAARAGTPAPTGGMASTPQDTFRLSDLEDAYAGDPDKVMDLPRLLDEAGLDPNGFTYDELSDAIDNAKKYGFSGRSRGNMARVLAGLQRDTELEDTFQGGKGTGIF